MTKAVSLSLSLIFLIATAPALPAQQMSPATEAANEAVLRQANTILLRQKIEDARNAQAHGDIMAAAKLYEDAYQLVQQIGSGIDAETAQTISGLDATHLELARRAQRAGNYSEADDQVTRVLRVDPRNAEALAFKKQNDDLIASMKGRVPDQATMEQIPGIMNDKTQAATLVQDGKVLYETGKFDEAEARFEQALQLDPDSQSAFYYMNVLKQAEYAREQQASQNMFQDKMVKVEKAWNPKVGIGLPVPNPYVTNTDVHTSASREAIYSKLDRIQIDSVSWEDGLPLSEVLRYLSVQSKQRDPDKVGINFIFNPNVESSQDDTGEGGGAPGAPVPIGANGLPETAAAPAETTVDPTAINIKLSLDHVRLQDLLDAIVMVSDHPIQYSVEDYAIVFSGKPTGPEPPTLEMRVFNVDPNTFYQGLQSVSAFVFGSANNSGSSGGSGGSSGGGGGGGGGGSGGSQNSISGAVVPVTDMAPGGSAERSSGGSGGGGGGGAAASTTSTGSGLTGAAGAAVSAGAGNGASALTGSVGNSTVFASGGGVAYITVPGYMQNVSLAAEGFFRAIGVNLSLPGRSIAFNDRLGLLFVKATPSELDTIERAVQALNQVAPEVHIKARFIEVTEDDNNALGFDWYLGNFINGTVVANGGSAPSLTVPNSPTGVFPGETAANEIAGSSSDQLLTSGLGYVNSATPPALATVTGIMTDPNFRVVLRALEQRGGTQELNEPDIVTTSGRQTQMRATDIEYILTGYSFQSGNTGLSTGGTGVP